MCQPRRPSSADRQIEAKRQVTRIALAMQDAFDRRSIDVQIINCEGVVTDLLNGGLIRPPKWPVAPPPPMRGQTTIDEQPGWQKATSPPNPQDRPPGLPSKP